MFVANVIFRTNRATLPPPRKIADSREQKKIKEKKHEKEKI